MLKMLIIKPESSAIPKIPDLKVPYHKKVLDALIDRIPLISHDWILSTIRASDDDEIPDLF
jgi:hypothetical protein